MIRPKATCLWPPATNPSAPSQIRPVTRQLYQLVKPPHPNTTAHSH